MHSRKSTDNGLTWLADETLSDVASPLPLQPDGTVQATYVGDYNYGSAIATEHVTSWADGRVPHHGQSQQDVFTDRELGGTPSPTPTASPSATATATATTYSNSDACQATYLHDGYWHWHITAGGTDIGNHCDDCFTPVNLPFPVNVYGAPVSVAFPRRTATCTLQTHTQDILLHAVCPGRSHSRRSVHQYPVSVL